MREQRERLSVRSSPAAVSLERKHPSGLERLLKNEEINKIMKDHGGKPNRRKKEGITETYR